LSHSASSGPDASGLRIGIAVSRFNQPITDKLLSACVETLCGHGCEDSQQRVVSVAGAFELPLACQSLLRSDFAPDAVIALGAVIRGQTPHFDYICQETTRGLGDVALRHHRPVSYGVLTTDNVEQAHARSGGVKGNKGVDAALVAIEMARLIKTAGG